MGAKDKGTNKEQSIRIEASTGLSDAEVSRMQEEAESHAEDDQKRRQQVDQRNEADQLLYASEKSLTEHGDKLEASERTPVEEAIAAVKQALEENDDDGLAGAVERLTQASHKLAEIMYQEAQAQQPPDRGTQR